MQKNLTTKHGILFFSLSLLALLIIGSLLQMNFGMLGLAGTQLMILLFAIIPAIMTKQNLKEVFPIKAFKISQLIGALLIWLPAYILVLFFSLLMLLFSPEGLIEVSEYMQDFFTSTSFPISLLVVAILPGICEEFLHRGFIQYTQRNLKNWQIILLMGIIFGIFHLSLYRFLPTAILGAALTIMMIETRNLLIPIIVHFVNNALALFVSFGNSGTQSALPTENELLISIGAFSIFLAFTPIIFLLGLKLLRGKNFKVFTFKKTLLIGLIFLVFSTIGSYLIVQASNEPILITNMQMGVNEETPPHILTFEVTETRNYMLSLKMSTEHGLINFVIEDLAGNTIYETTAMSVFLNNKLFLETGQYRVIYTFVGLENQEEYLTFETEIKIE